MRSTINFTALALLASVAFPVTAKAAILNGGFENGLNNWEVIGDYSIETATFGK